MTDPTAPKISVLMSVLNGEEFLAEAMDSILAQTFKDFEFIVVNNASTDRTAEIIDSYDDARIVHIRNESTLNLSQSLNKGLGVAKGQYVARLDADDIAFPARLEQQAQYLDAHPDVALVASAFSEFGNATPFPGTIAMAPPENHDDLMAALARNSILAHSSILFRRDAARAIGGYNEAYAYCMDYLLYFRLAENHKLAALTNPMVAVRVHGGQITALPEWEARRHLEAVAAFRDILAHQALAPVVRRGIRRYLIVTSLRLSVLYAKSINPGKSLLWGMRGIAEGPILFSTVICAAVCRKLHQSNA